MSRRASSQDGSQDRASNAEPETLNMVSTGRSGGGLGGMLAGLGSGGAGGMFGLITLGLFIFNLAALVTKGGSNRMEWPAGSGLMSPVDVEPKDFRCFRDPVTGNWRTDADENVDKLFAVMVTLVVIDGLMSFGLACLSAGACCVFGACCLADGVDACDAWCINCFTASSGILISLLYLAQFICSAIVTYFWIELSQDCRARMAYDIHYYYDSIAFRSIFFLVVGIILLISALAGVLSCCFALCCPECCRDCQGEPDSDYEDTTSGYDDNRVRGTKTTTVVMVPPNQGGGGGYGQGPAPQQPYGPPAGGGYGAPQPPPQGYGPGPSPPVRGQPAY